MIPREIGDQVRELVAGLEAVLEEDLVGVYLHGSAVLGCFGPWSDVDLVVIASRPTKEDEKRQLVVGLLETSGPYEPAGPPRPVELDLILARNLRPWRHPTPFDFHYGESLRDRFTAGELEPWESRESHDLAAHVTVLRRAGVALAGPPVEKIFPEVPWADYVDALTRDLEWCRTRFAELPRYGVLSVARIWATLASGIPQSKASGAEWALQRLSSEIRPVLEHGFALYRGVEHAERWAELPVADYVGFITEEIYRTERTFSSRDSR